MQSIVNFIQANKAYFDAAQAFSSAINLLGWLAAAILLFIAWRRNSIRSVSVGPFNFQIQDAVTATATAVRNWGTTAPNQKVDIERIRGVVSRAFEPNISSELAGRSILWVDDNPANNELAVRALKKLQVDIEQVTSTEAGLSSLIQRRFDLVITDMGRGTNLRAGYDLLQAMRSADNSLPVFIFSSSDRPEHRREAAQLGAQLATNDMIELIDNVIRFLGR